MKKSLITEITIWLLVGLMLLFTVIYGLSNGFGFEVFSKEKTASQSMNYSNEYTQAKDSLGSFKIYWLAGDVNIKSGDTKNIQITEYSSEELTDDNKLSINVSGTVLNISWDDTRLIYLDTVIPEVHKKNLEIVIPSGMSIDKITVNGVQSSVSLDSLTADQAIVIKSSSDLNIKDCKTQSMTLTTAYGNISCSGVTAQTLSASGENTLVSLSNTIAYNTTVKNSTGDISFDGEFNNLTVDSVSGNVAAETKVQTENIDINTAKGNITLKVPSDVTSQVSYSTLSGAFSTDFVDSGFSTKSGELNVGSEQSGNSIKTFSLKSTTGNIVFNKGESAGKNSVSFA